MENKFPPPPLKKPQTKKPQNKPKRGSRQQEFSIALSSLTLGSRPATGLTALPRPNTATSSRRAGGDRQQHWGGPCHQHMPNFSPPAAPNISFVNTLLILSHFPSASPQIFPYTDTKAEEMTSHGGEGLGGLNWWLLPILAAPSQSPRSRTPYHAQAPRKAHRKITYPFPQPQQC